MKNNKGNDICISRDIEDDEDWINIKCCGELLVKVKTTLWKERSDYCDGYGFNNKQRDDIISIILKLYG